MAWGIVYFKTKDGRVPAEDFLDDCPVKIEARFNAVLEAVRDAPPPQFSGGGYWEAMHGDMGGFHEIRLTGPGRRQYRLFCVLDNGSSEELRDRGFDAPQREATEEEVAALEVAHGPFLPADGEGWILPSSKGRAAPVRLRPGSRLIMFDFYNENMIISP